MRILILALLGVLLQSCSKPEERQNFVFILVDDLGWTDLGYSGSTFYETPHIDRFSESAIVFNNAYASGSVCSPTRASIITGQHPARINITDWLPGLDPKDQMLRGTQDLNELPLHIPTLSKSLNDNGYRTFFAGKWHLGGEGYLPQDQGFDVNLGGHHRGQPPGGYYAPYNNPQLEDGPEGEYLTDRLTNESINFIGHEDQAPFFLFLSYYTVHTPIQANKKHIEYFEKKLEKLPSAAISQRVDKNGLTTLNQVNADYASMVYALDENVGRLIEKLKKEDLYDNTTIVFTSDNGGLSTLDNSRKRSGPTSVRPLRGGKGWLYEGGIRVPLLIKPAHHQLQNVTSNVPVISTDFYPTILSMAQVPLPDNHKVDGVDLTNILTDQIETIEREALYWHYPHYHGSGWTPGAAIREGDWKLIEFYETNTIELYNLSDDLSEQNDLSDSNADKAESMRNKLHSFQYSVNAKMPILNEHKQEM